MNWWAFLISMVLGPPVLIALWGLLVLWDKLNRPRYDPWGFLVVPSIIWTGVAVGVGFYFA